MLVEILPAASFERIVTLHGGQDSHGLNQWASSLKSVDRGCSVESKVERRWRSNFDSVVRRDVAEKLERSR
jgi:hypothetical protein